MALSAKERADLDRLRRRAYGGGNPELNRGDLDRMTRLIARDRQAAGLPPRPTESPAGRRGRRSARGSDPAPSTATAPVRLTRRRRALTAIGASALALALIGIGAGLGRASIAWAPPEIVAAMPAEADQALQRTERSWNWDRGSVAVVALIDDGLFVAGTIERGARFCAVRAEIGGGPIPAPACGAAIPGTSVVIDPANDVAPVAASGETPVIVATIADDGTMRADVELSVTSDEQRPVEIPPDTVRIELPVGVGGTPFNDLPDVSTRYDWDEGSLRLVGAFGLATVWAGTRDTGNVICIVAAGPVGEQDTCDDERRTYYDVSEMVREVAPDTAAVAARVRLEETGFRLLLEPAAG